jgi:pimeloyl-ACP methyl ester carboxylesterase
LLLHGAGMDHRVWDAQLAALGAEGLASCAPDLPGHGGSDGPALTGIAEMAAWVLRLADALHIDRVALAGHSMGALVALEAAGQLQSRLSGLALIGAAAEMPVNPALLACARTDLPQAAAMIASWGYGPSAQADGRAEAGRRIIEAAPPGALASDLAACAAYSGAPAAAARVKAPTVVISGGKDRMTPSPRGRALAESIGGAQFLELPEIGHMLMAEAPAELSAALIRLLQ